MNDNRKSRTFPRRTTEHEARRLGWHRACPITWREFLEQYPYGASEMGAARHAFETAA
jgi:hypothetical protein